MSTFILLGAIAVCVGIAVAFQGHFMGSMDRTVGTATSVLVTYGVGAVIAAMIWLGARGPAVAGRQVPWYGWLAGPLGLVIVGGIGFAAPRLGLARTLVITVAAQMVAALILDHFGAFGGVQRAFDGMRAAGLLLTVGGVWLIVR
ncbi:MAG TPA: DMT family transporter [Thermoanaerobaculia bacterium]|nr:DMT family transporter [Thermoanaerobaculia bacterium]